MSLSADILNYQSFTLNPDGSFITKANRELIITTKIQGVDYKYDSALIADIDRLIRHYQELSSRGDIPSTRITRPIKV